MNVRFENESRFVDLDVRGKDGMTIGRINFEQVKPGQVIRSLDGRTMYQKHPRDGSLRNLEPKLTPKVRKALKRALRAGEKRHT